LGEVFGQLPRGVGLVGALGEDVLDLPLDVFHVLFIFGEKFERFGLLIGVDRGGFVAGAGA
jgi:hypothetical protein